MISKHPSQLILLLMEIPARPKCNYHILRTLDTEENERFKRHIKL